MIELLLEIKDGEPKLITIRGLRAFYALPRDQELLL